MRKMLLALGCAAMVAPSLMVTVTTADAQRRYRDSDRNGRVYRDNRGRLRCKKKDGTTGAIIGGVGGALLGRTVDTRGDRTLGTLGGAAAGALAGRAIDRGSGNDRCR
ncbi:glycine zipper 2TM domain-containing protein [Sphingomonas sp. CFBP 8760]|uniref:glycine zipper 2TM domain-containing protein n=1 Tax=Sphingomonas sp. CFBP 8760 TaxID=2775282 RepID=UPI001786EDD7|nr:glycine zipper 2TM domain-containing protein [Sphingomonas sp. CFBP 8760]MBD8546149.1 glycine zipper 2TM domain-containing protein [Sphingomonas sp. CFBP 8760]